MSKVLLVDFGEDERNYLASRSHDVELVRSGSLPESEALSGSMAAAEAVCVSLSAGPVPSDGELGPALALRLEKGGLTVLFPDGDDPERLAALSGVLRKGTLEAVGRPEGLRFSPRALFHVPFERFRPFLAKAFKLTDKPLAEGEWDARPAGGAPLEVFAKSADGFPVSALVRKGRGMVLILPSFAEHNAEIIAYLLKNKSFMESRSGGVQMPEWLDNDEYSFPEIKSLVQKKEDEIKRHEQAIAEIETMIREESKRSQEYFHNLLAAEGPDLKKAVLETFKYLGWPRVVDVEEYWKKVIRNREEDIWLLEGVDRPLEAGLKMEDIILVVVRSDKNWASDEDCILLQKYKGRRMQEFGNTRMRSVLVGNYFSASEPVLRQTPFSAVQIEEAVKDGNGLLSTWELFKAVKAEKEGRLSKEAIRAAIKTASGLLAIKPE